MENTTATDYPVGINRNIVECKGITDMDYRSGQHRINRNIVECKAVQHPEMLLQQNGINRNIVECKVFF